MKVSVINFQEQCDQVLCFVMPQKEVLQTSLYKPREGAECEPYPLRLVYFSFWKNNITAVVLLLNV